MLVPARAGRTASRSTCRGPSAPNQSSVVEYGPELEPAGTLPVVRRPPRRTARKGSACHSPALPRTAPPDPTPCARWYCWPWPRSSVSRCPRCWRPARPPPPPTASGASTSSPDGAWAFAQKGPDQTVPTDGAVEGWRFAVGDESRHPLPARRPDLRRSICGTTTAAAGQQARRRRRRLRPPRRRRRRRRHRRRRQSAVRRRRPPRRRAPRCSAAAGDLRTDKSLTCAVYGYPATGCGGEVKHGAAPPRRPPTRPSTIAGRRGRPAAPRTAAAAGRRGRAADRPAARPATWVGIRHRRRRRARRSSATCSCAAPQRGVLSATPDRPCDRCRSLPLPRLLHPAAWWLWGLGLATAASRTTNPLLLLLVVAVAGVVVVLERREAGDDRRRSARSSSSAWSSIALRVVMAALLGGGVTGREVLFRLPEVPLPEWTAGVRLGGAGHASRALLAAAYDGLRLAAILACLGRRERAGQPAPAAALRARHALRRRHGRRRGPDLRPAAGRRRRAASGRPARLRGHAGRGLREMARLAVPVLDGALERSLGPGRLDGVARLRSRRAPHRRGPARAPAR